MKNAQLHSTILAVAGAYVLSIAWDFFSDLRAGKSTMARPLCIALIVFFTLAGAAVIGYAWKVWRDDRRKKPEDETPAQDDGGFRS